MCKILYLVGCKFLADINFTISYFRYLFKFFLITKQQQSDQMNFKNISFQQICNQLFNSNRLCVLCRKGSRKPVIDMVVLYSEDFYMVLGRFITISGEEITTLPRKLFLIFPLFPLTKLKSIKGGGLPHPRHSIAPKSFQQQLVENKAKEQVFSKMMLFCKINKQVCQNIFKPKLFCLG